jgi:NitT/TauT family transport system permease protein
LNSYVPTGFRATISVITFVACWELLARSGTFNRFLFPAPSDVAAALRQWAASGQLFSDLEASLWRGIAGLIAGWAVGVAIGLLTGRVKVLRNYLSPLMSLLRPLPPVAMIPLTIVWFGIGSGSKVLAIAFAVFFPVWTSVHEAARAIPDYYLWAARSLNLGRARTVLKIVLPATVSGSLAGTRIAISLAFVMVYVSEIAGSSSGLGYRISVAHLDYRIDRMVAALCVLAATAACTELLVIRGVTGLLPWIGRR